jgi:sugar phosphate isomerase/epimerase
LKVGIDNYCYHKRYEAEVSKRWTTLDFIKRAKELQVDGVSIETCFFESFEKSYLEKIKSLLDEVHMERVLAWGHPSGLEGGKNLRAAEDLKSHFETAKILGAKVMRIVASSWRFRHESHREQIDRVTEILKPIADLAASYDIKMALENHIDFTSDEILEILDGVGSKYLGVNLDTGNALRMLEDPIEATRKLAPYTLSTHIKDIGIGKGSPQNRDFWLSVPLGKGVIDIPEVVSILKSVGYSGLLNVEVDVLRWDWPDEDVAVEESVRYLKSALSALKCA